MNGRVKNYLKRKCYIDKIQLQKSNFYRFMSRGASKVFRLCVCVKNRQLNRSTIHVTKQWKTLRYLRGIKHLAASSLHVTSVPWTPPTTKHLLVPLVLFSLCSVLFLADGKNGALHQIPPPCAWSAAGAATPPWLPAPRHFP